MQEQLVQYRVYILTADDENVSRYAPAGANFHSNAGNTTSRQPVHHFGNYICGVFRNSIWSFEDF
jgi:hypothetical protein